MNILLNNKIISVSATLTIKGLLDHVDVKKKYYAVEVNEQIVPKSSHATFALKEGDKVEIVTAIGGG